VTGGAGAFKQGRFWLLRIGGTRRWEWGSVDKEKPHQPKGAKRANNKTEEGRGKLPGAQTVGKGAGFYGGRKGHQILRKRPKRKNQKNKTHSCPESSSHRHQRVRDQRFEYQPE